MSNNMDILIYTELQNNLNNTNFKPYTALMNKLNVNNNNDLNNILESTTLKKGCCEGKVNQYNPRLLDTTMHSFDASGNQRIKTLTFPSLLCDKDYINIPEKCDKFKSLYCENSNFLYNQDPIKPQSWNNFSTFCSNYKFIDQDDRDKRATLASDAEKQKLKDEEARKLAVKNLQLENDLIASAKALQDASGNKASNIILINNLTIIKNTADAEKNKAILENNLAKLELDNAPNDSAKIEAARVKAAALAVSVENAVKAAKDLEDAKNRGLLIDNNLDVENKKRENIILELSNIGATLKKNNDIEARAKAEEDAKVALSDAAKAKADADKAKADADKAIADSKAASDRAIADSKAASDRAIAEAAAASALAIADAKAKAEAAEEEKALAAAEEKAEAEAKAKADAEAKAKEETAKGSSQSPYMWIGIGAGIFCVIIIIIVVFMMKKSKKSKNINR